MTRFYFDTVVNHSPAQDDLGIELAGREKARSEALRAAADMAKDFADRGELAEIEVNVRDGDVPVLSARLSLRVE